MWAWRGLAGYLEVEGRVKDHAGGDEREGGGGAERRAVPKLREAAALHKHLKRGEGWWGVGGGGGGAPKGAARRRCAARRRGAAAAGSVRRRTVGIGARLRHVTTALSVAASKAYRKVHIEATESTATGSQRMRSRRLPHVIPIALRPRMQTVARFHSPRITMARANWRTRRVEGSGIVKSESLLKIADDAEHT